MKHLLSCVLLVLLLSAACTLFHMTPLMITAYSPAEEILNDPQEVMVSVTFSAPVDHTEAELAFSLTAGGTVLEGTFNWEGDKLSFIPYKPYLMGETYTISVKQTVEDKFGNSMEKEFAREFRTGADKQRPFVTSCTPTAGAVIDDLFHPIRIEFNEAVRHTSFYTAFSLSPAVKGSFSWTDEGRTCIFTPLTAYSWQTDYLVRLSSTLQDLQRNTLEDDYSFRFHTGADSEPPSVTSAGNASGSLTLIQDSEEDTEYTITGSWESDFDIRLEFSEPLQEKNLRSLLRFEPAWDYTLEWDDPSRPLAATLRGNTRFSYNAVYTMRIGSGLQDICANKSPASYCWHFRVDGPLTAPPRVSRVTCRTQPAGPIGAPLVPYGNISFRDFDNNQEGFLDIYLDLAVNAEPDPFSFMQAFLISTTNDCASILINRMEYDTFTDPQPDPSPDSTIGEKVMRVYLGIKDNAGNTGLVNIRLSTALQDTAGNPLAQEWEMILVETP